MCPDKHSHDNGRITTEREPATPAAVKSNIGLGDEARFEVGQLLNLLLADEWVLYATTRDYHWNAPGPEFLRLRRHLEAQYERVAEWIDQVAEKAREVGAGVRGSWTEMSQAARSTAEPGLGLPAEYMLSQLIALHEEIIEHLRTNSEECTERLSDPATAGFLAGLIVQHEEAVWELRAQLETDDLEPSTIQTLEPQPSPS